MAALKFAESILNGIHHDLTRLSGHWSGITKVWFEPGKLADESPVTAEARSVLGGRFLHFEYQGSLEGKPIEGLMIIGCSLGTQQLQCAWVDSFHNGTSIMFSENNGTQFPFSVLGSYGAEPRWGWRTNIEFSDKNKLTISMFNIAPGGKDEKAVEMSFTRNQN